MALSPASRIVAIVGGAAIAVAGLTTTTRGAASSSTRSIPVEVWRGGDDRLTQAFASSLEAAFRASSSFVLSRGKQPGTLIVTITTGMRWQEVTGRRLATYSIEFTDVNSKPLGASSGRCLEQALSLCAEQVLKDASVATASWSGRT